MASLIKQQVLAKKAQAQKDNQGSILDEFKGGVEIVYLQGKNLTGIQFQQSAFKQGNTFHQIKKFAKVSR